MANHESYMRRCIELAARGIGHTAPNPMVGAILVYGDRIIGEGFHRQYGQAHAEVNCIDSVIAADRHLIAQSTLYVSLEPCTHFGKTPPCTDLIISNAIRKVVVGCQDPFSQVDGKGIGRLRQAGIDVTCGILEQDCRKLNKRFFTFHTRKRPFVILKWAQTADGMIGTGSTERLLISGNYANRLVHRWRSEEPAILIGTNTALLDNPRLSNRYWHGSHPVRLVLDMSLRLPENLHLFDQSQQTVIFNRIKHAQQGNILYYQIKDVTPLATQLLDACFTLELQSILVEGGAQLLQTFIDAGQWDEARVIVNDCLAMEGIPAPVLTGIHTCVKEKISLDTFYHYTNKEMA